MNEVEEGPCSTINYILFIYLYTFFGGGWVGLGWGGVMLCYVRLG